VPTRPWRNDDAKGSGPAYDRADAASRTRWAVASATGPFPLNTRDAVDVDTPARRATSRSVGRRGVDRV
jgi:hypothetical protein